MKKTQGLTVAAVILFVFGIMYMILGISLWTFPSAEYTESNTFAYFATVDRVEEVGGEYRIYMMEYGVCLAIRPVQLVSPRTPTDLSSGEKISFRTMLAVEGLGASESYVLSLSGEGGALITLERSNELQAEGMQRSRIVSIAFSAVLLVGAVCLMVVVVRRKRQNKAAARGQGCIAAPGADAPCAAPFLGGRAVHVMRLAKIPYESMKRGEKTVEVRLNDEKRQAVKVGDVIVFECKEGVADAIAAQVVALHHFDRFAELFASVLLSKTGCTGMTAKEAAESLYRYYTKEQEERYGVLGIEIKCLTP